MADKYINETGLVAIRNWANGKFALDADLDTLDARVDEIIAEGGEPNVIETVKVNGTALVPDAQKAVDVLVPTDLSELTNTAQDPYATEGYVDQNGGKIDVIKVNGTTQTITNKEVDLPVPQFTNGVENNNKYATIGYTNGYQIKIKDIIEQGTLIPTVELKIFNSDGTEYFGRTLITLAKLTNYVNSVLPTKVSDLTNDANYQNDTQVDAKIASAVASAVTLKGSVATYSALPSTGQKHGDMYDVLDTGKNYVWIVEEGTGRWDDYAGTMDMSAYWTSTAGQANTLEAMTVAEINAILEPSV